MKNEKRKNLVSGHKYSNTLDFLYLHLVKAMFSKINIVVNRGEDAVGQFFCLCSFVQKVFNYTFSVILDY